MGPDPLDIDLQLEAYLDGCLSQSDRARFEEIAASRADLQAQIELHRSAQASLSRLFAESKAANGDLQLGVHRPRVRLASLAVAAAIVLAGLGVILYAARPSFLSGPNPLHVAYQEQVDRGFRPDVVCTDPAAFADWMRTYFGEPLYPAHADGVEFVGWAYAPAVSPRSGVLLARVNNQPVVVVVDYALRDNLHLAVPDAGRLHQFRAQIGPLVLYEVTPLDQASILPLLSQVPPPGTKLTEPAPTP